MTANGSTKTCFFFNRESTSKNNIKITSRNESRQRKTKTTNIEQELECRKCTKALKIIYDRHYNIVDRYNVFKLPLMYLHIIYLYNTSKTSMLFFFLMFNHTRGDVASNTGSAYPTGASDLW